MRSSSGTGDVLVRCVDLALDDDAVARAEETLAPAERARARRGTPAVHRRRVALRAALRAALAEELGMVAADVPLGAGPAGQPRPAAVGLHVSCSADGDLGLVAVGRRRRVGVDVERVVAWSAEVLDEGWLDLDERRALAALPAVDRPVAATRAWTRKEAVLKARGTGLREHPASITTPVGRPASVVAGWELRDVPVPAGWVASLAVGPVEEVRA
ncbi:4'-phosphopantetheinyl transferase family protein [Geodermatophilus sp. SYSU D00815]